MDQMDGIQLHNSKNSSTSPPTLHRDIDITIVRTKKIPRARDIQILQCTSFPNHFIRFSAPKIENLFQTRDKILKVKALGMSSRLVCWRLCQNIEFQHHWQLEGSDEQIFSPFNFHSLFKILLLQLKANIKSSLNNEFHQSNMNNT